MSALRGSVPNWISLEFVKPSLSGSAFGSDPGTVSVLKDVVPGRNPSPGVKSDAPAALVATTVYRPLAAALTATLKVADVPFAAMETPLMVMPEDGENAKVDPLRLSPPTANAVIVVPASADFGLIDVTTGIEVSGILPTSVMPPGTGAVAADWPLRMTPPTVALA